MIVYRSKQFDKSLKKILLSGNIKLSKIEEVIGILSNEKIIPKQYNHHALKGDWLGYRECHIQTDLLLIYKIEKDKLILILINIGNHSQLFR
ncbi:MAG TPA: type II toxin-antitoxin system YafQ family toxin [Candidatus Paceibacterota bacterium]|nr:type II toxin-antitoxin system YafQ family toxin [Candidatus Paceibacterota bacterium]HMP85126.1 type II toxin-antitoxin system YafQ family toxin [Candidatus Paceibacterota bacterium]